jgi:mannose-6-phosphate isomerase
MPGSHANCKRLKAAIRNPQSAIDSPLIFQPIFMERIWGGRRLESAFGKRLPAAVDIGESWEIVDREEAQSVVRHGPFRDLTLHDLWMQDRQLIFGDVPKSPRFPLLIKLLDAHDRLSLQVHPPEQIASSLGGEPKTEFWYVADSTPGGRLFVGLRNPITRDEFERAVHSGKVAELVHTITVQPGDAMFLPAGRFHAIGGGNLLLEVQQNSDTTYRVFDWNRVDDHGKPRQLHLNQALQSIDFNDVAPKLIQPSGETLVRHELFEIQKWSLHATRDVTPLGQFAIVCCLSGKLRCVDVDLLPGELFLVPASLQDRELKPLSSDTTLLRVTIPALAGAPA